MAMSRMLTRGAACAAAVADGGGGPVPALAGGAPTGIRAAEPRGPVDAVIPPGRRAASAEGRSAAVSRSGGGAAAGSRTAEGASASGGTRDGGGGGAVSLAAAGSAAAAAPATGGAGVPPQRGPSADQLKAITGVKAATSMPPFGGIQAGLAALGPGAPPGSVARHLGKVDYWPMHTFLLDGSNRGTRIRTATTQMMALGMPGLAHSMVRTAEQQHLAAVRAGGGRYPATVGTHNGSAGAGISDIRVSERAGVHTMTFSHPLGRAPAPPPPAAATEVRQARVAPHGGPRAEGPAPATNRYEGRDDVGMLQHAAAHLIKSELPAVWLASGRVTRCMVRGCDGAARVACTKCDNDGALGGRILCAHHDREVHSQLSSFFHPREAWWPGRPSCTPLEYGAYLAAGAGDTPDLQRLRALLALRANV